MCFFGSKKHVNWSHRYIYTLYRWWTLYSAQLQTLDRVHAILNAQIIADCRLFTCVFAHTVNYQCYKKRKMAHFTLSLHPHQKKKPKYWIAHETPTHNSSQALNNCTILFSMVLSLWTIKFKWNMPGGWKISICKTFIHFVYFIRNIHRWVSVQTEEDRKRKSCEHLYARTHKNVKPSSIPVRLFPCHFFVWSHRILSVAKVCLSLFVFLFELWCSSTIYDSDV